MRKRNVMAALCAAAGLVMSVTANAQLSTNPDKFLGNITTQYNMDTDGFSYYKYWNQVTPENESKWASIEGTRNSFNWGGCDNAFNYAKNHKFPFKFHCLVWGSQYPSWMDNLDTKTQYKEIVEWMDAVKKHYPNLDMIDVVNEALPGHAPAPYKEALGGDGVSGYDWIVNAFEMAHERWPEAILIYNDYNTFQWNTDQFIDLCTKIRDAGAPIDAYGCQSHDLTDISFTNFKSSMVKLQNALKMPMYSSEYDIGTADDQKQLQQYKDQIQYMWEQDYVAGITLWGWIYGKTWVTDGNSGIIKNKVDRPAMTWLKEYMATDAAKTAKSPFPNMKKPYSIYIKPEKYKPEINEETTITVDATLHNGNTIEKVEFFINNVATDTLTEAPYTIKYTSAKRGSVKFKAIVYDSAGNKYERLGGIVVVGPRSPFKGEPIELPGTIEAEDFDRGDDGIAFHDSDTKNDGTTAYRTDGAGVDIVTGNGGYAIGYTANGEWLEYTVNVTQAGTYEYEALASSGATNSSFSILMNREGTLTTLAGPLVVPCVQSGSWDTYSKITGRCSVELPEGKYAIRLAINGSNCNIDKVKLTHITVNNDIKIAISADKAPATINEATTLSVDASCATANITKVQLYVNDVLKKTFTEAPYDYSYRPTATGKQTITAVATDENGAKSKIASYTLTVNPKRTPFKGAIALPGTLEAENFDKCAEGVSYHDSDDKDEGKAGYRTDNGGVDIVKSDNRYVIGYTAANEWLEYTVDIKEAGKYSYEATVSNGASSNGGFKLSLVGEGGKLTTLFTRSFAGTGGWDTYTTIKGTISTVLQEGEQIFRITLNNPANCNIDKIVFTCTAPTGIDEVIELPVGQCDVYTTTGVYIGKVNMTSTVGQQIYELTGRHGVYVVKDATGKAKLISSGR